MFFEVLSAINDPDKQASIAQLSQMTSSVHKLGASQGLSDNQMQSMMTALGGALQPVLKQKKSKIGGMAGMAGILSKVAGTGNTMGLQAMIPSQIQQELAQTVAQKTGMNATMVQVMLPQLLPAVMGLFNMGSPKPGSDDDSNPLLKTFLESDRDRDTDLGSVVKFAGRFLNASN